MNDPIDRIITATGLGAEIEAETRNFENRTAGSDWRIEEAARLIWIKPAEAEKIPSNVLK